MATAKVVNKLDQWLFEKDISQAEASRRLGIAQATVSRIRCGEPPTLRNASCIVHATDGEITYEDLLGPKVRKQLYRFDSKLQPLDPEKVARELPARIRERKRKQRRVSERAAAA